MAACWENSCSFGLRYVSWYGYLIVSLVFSHLGFWSGNLFLIAPFPDLCLLVPFFQNITLIEQQQKYCLGTLSNLKYLGVGLKPVLQGPNITLIFCSGSQYSVSRSVLVVNL